jgi:membrane-bound metal-dependent hydrolase YbcI (DUF457 family)
MNFGSMDGRYVKDNNYEKLFSIYSYISFMLPSLSVDRRRVQIAAFALSLGLPQHRRSLGLTGLNFVLKYLPMFCQLLEQSSKYSSLKFVR